MPNKNQEISANTKKVKLNFIYPDNLETKFINHMIVQAQRDYFTLSFFETILPPVLGESEDEKKALFDKLESVDSKCMARLIITPEKMSDLINALEVNLKNRNQMISLEIQKKQG
jgi:hypothetical protein